MDYLTLVEAVIQMARHHVDILLVLLLRITNYFVIDVILFAIYL
jgi:hypothetical protein